MPEDFTRRRVLGAGFVYLGAMGATYLWFGRKSGGNSYDGVQELRVWDKNAKSYDREVGFDETLMGLSLMRRWLLRKAKGNVLEVSAGTGRNTMYYSPVRISGLYLTDNSKRMLDVAQTKKNSFSPQSVHYKECSVEALPYDDNEFDTVVDTFGLCSCANPQVALSEMARVCKPGGQILLLEHGQSHYQWMNSILDSNAAKHFERWGCRWNRDILSMVFGEKTDVSITSTNRFHFGTTYMIQATPKSHG
eukprot:CFRG7902T1